ncbi:MAG: DUF4350 domain-containing protein [Thermoplasmata archaeon]
MNEFLKKVTLYVVIGSIVLLILFLSLSAPVVTTDADFSVYNPGWNGCSDLAVRTNQVGKFTPNLELESGESMDVTQKELTQYSLSANGSSLVILGPKQNFTESETEYIDSFMKKGGIVVLSDDFGSGNSLLNGLNTSSRFIGDPVLDLSFEKKPDFGVAYNVRDSDITQNVSYVLLNKPTGIVPGRNAKSYMNSSEASWIDRNNNGMNDPGEERRHIPLLTMEEYGEGKLILVSDPSIFINSMREELDNRILTNNILDYASSGRNNIVFDESHREVNLVQGMVYRGQYPSETITFLILVIGLGVSLSIIVPDFKNIIFKGIMYVLSIFVPNEEDNDLIDELLEENPEWDRDKLEMIFDKFGNT